MKTTYYTLTIATAVALAACGRPSTSNYFELDGVGDPNAPVTGNPVPGRWGGNIELTNYAGLFPGYSIFSDGAPFQLSQAYFNTPEIGGLGGWGLLGISTAAPPRLDGRKSACYMNAAALPVLGGNLKSTDLGEDIDFDFSGDGDVTGMQLTRDDDEDISAGDLLSWTTPFNNALLDLIPSGVEVDMEWDGGTLNGYKRAPPLQGRKVLQFPQEFMVGTTAMLPTINSIPISSTVVASDDEYVIEWNQQTSELEGEDPDEDLMGVELIFTVYGPINFGDTVEYQVANDSPFNTRLAHIVCLVDDSEEKFTIFESQIDTSENDEYSPFTLQELMEVALGSGKYEAATEDVTGNGKLDREFTCGPPTAPTTCTEDGNQNGLIDKIHGVSLTINRRTERYHELDIGDNGQSQIFISGNNSKMVKLAYGSPPARCGNGIDDDNDGLTDLEDPGCADEWDSVEISACADGIDNDSDGKIDGAAAIQGAMNGTPGTTGLALVLADPDCSSRSDDTEN